jgi:hypothetical protein
LIERGGQRHPVLAHGANYQKQPPVPSLRLDPARPSFDYSRAFSLLLLPVSKAGSANGSSPTP